MKTITIVLITFSLLVCEPKEVKQHNRFDDLFEQADSAFYNQVRIKTDSIIVVNDLQN